MPNFKKQGRGFKMKGFSAHKGVSSPLNKYKSDAQRKAVHASKAESPMKKYKDSPMKMAKPDYPDIDGDGNRKESMKKAAADKKSPLNRRSADERIARAVEKGNVKKAARISERQARKGKTKVAPTSIPVNDKSMKNYNKAVDERVGKKVDAPKNEVKVDASNKVVTPKVTKVTPKKSKPVKTLRGTGKTYKSAWEGMSAEKKAGFKGGYSEFESKAKSYNKKKDIKEGTKLKEGTQGPVKPYKNPNAGQKGPLNKKKNKY